MNKFSLVLAAIATLAIAGAAEARDKPMMHGSGMGMHGGMHHGGMHHGGMHRSMGMRMDMHRHHHRHHMMRRMMRREGM